MRDVSDVPWGPPALIDAVRVVLDSEPHGPDAAHFAAMVAASPSPADRAKAFVGLGAAHVVRGDISAALAAWRQAAASGSAEPAACALYHLGLLHAELGLRDLALDQFEAAWEHRPSPWSDLAAVAVAHVQHSLGRSEVSDDLARLIAHLTETAPESAALADALLGSGAVAERDGDIDRAVRAYEAVTTLPDRTRAAIATEALVRVLHASGRDVDAMVEGLAGEVVGAMAVERVETMLEQGRHVEVEATIAAIDRSKLTVPDRFRLVSALREGNLVNLAIDELEQLSRSGSNEIQDRALYSLAEVYSDHQMPDAAASMLERVVSRHGYWPDRGALFLGDLAFASDDREAAARQWTRAAASEVLAVANEARERLADAMRQARSNGRTSGPGAAIVADLTGAEPIVVDLAARRPAIDLPPAPPAVADLDDRVAGVVAELKWADDEPEPQPHIVNLRGSATNVDAPEIVLIEDRIDTPTTSAEPRIGAFSRFA